MKKQHFLFELASAAQTLMTFMCLSVQFPLMR